ncbi:siderophore ABC transporter substrate-binding protein [Streptococcaceae bacterium ESL0729]|nr:siderophore ABC transporter substrate-binding protein [Streptococcaceae bacterium ESL0729]
MKKMLSALVVLVALTGLVACGSKDTSKSSEASSSAQSEASSQKTIKIKDSNGEKEVPYNPQKVVVFDFSSLDTMDSLGLKDRVTGLPTSSLPSYLDQYKDITSVGGVKEPDLEKVNQLKPDLIIIAGRQKDYEEQLSKIAPTVFFAPDSKTPWESTQESIKELAKIFGKEKEADEKIAKIQKSMDSMKAANEKSDKKAMIIMASEGSLSTYGKGSRFGIVYDSYGFKPADEDVKASTHGQNVSYEYIAEKNPDIIFVIDRTKAIGGDDSKNDLAANDLVKETKAGKNNQVISLDPQVWYLAGSGLESLDVMTSDLQKAE